MEHDCLKLTTYFGERDRCGDRFLGDALVDLYAREQIRASVLLRGVEGFGMRHRLQTQRLLTLSEDLPLVCVAIDARERIASLVDEVQALSSHGLISLERARMVSAEGAGELPSSPHPDAAIKLTIYVGRQAQIGGRAAHLAVVDLLQREGVAGATALLGVDGTTHGVRRRAGFFARNAEVPVMIISVGAEARVAAVLPQLGAMLDRPLMTLERVELCKRDGRLLTPPRDSAVGGWRKLMVYIGEHARHEGRPVYSTLIERLRGQGADGATVLRGFWGYHGDHAPHGDSFWSLRRRVPVLCVIVDRPERIGRWFATVDELTGETGLVTSENVPAVRAGTPGLEQGRLEL